MRYLLNAAIVVAAVVIAAPSAAQVSAPGPVYYNPSAAPIPGPPMAPHYPRADQPAHYNQPGAPYAPPRGAPMPQQQQGEHGRVWQDGRWVSMPAHVPGPGYAGDAGRGQRWGNQINGRWWGGSQAPGGWSAYRRPRHGATIPGYWLQPDFQIPDYLSFGLSAPPYGYFWVRYYDDAVLVDSRGSVQNSVSGIGWTGAVSASSGHGYASSSASAYAQGGGIGYVDPNPDYYGYPGGSGPSVPYGPPAVQTPYPAYSQPCPSVCPQPQGYQGGGYYAGGATTTTVVIQSAPVITTTVIEEIVTEEVVTYTAPRATVRRAAPAPRRYVAKPKPKPRPKPRPVARQCGCQCVCR